MGGLSFCPAEAVANGDEEMIELSVAAKRDFPAFVASLEEASGVSTRHRKWPTLMVARTDADDALMNRVETARNRIGIVIQSSSATRRIPAISCSRAGNRDGPWCSTPSPR